jgi:hypothetical protein
LKSVLNKEFTSPSVEFTKLLAKQVYTGTITSKILDQFTLLVKKSISGLISDTISERLKTALKTETGEQDNSVSQEQSTEQIEQDTDNKVITTDIEIEGYYIVKAILRPHFPSERVIYRDAQTYFAILADDNNRKPICRLYLNSPTNWQIAFIGDDKKEMKIKIHSLDEIYNYSDEIIKSAVRYIEKENE